jgi:type II secretory pathway pseudopilin PulG
MDKIFIFMIILIVMLVILLWTCLVMGARADENAKKLKEQTKRFNQLQRQYNTINLCYKAQKEALDAANEKSSNAKH